MNPNPVLVASLNGRRGLTIDSGPSITLNTGTSFDRLQLWSSNGGNLYLIDAMPAIAVSNWITIESQGDTLSRIRFLAHLRCYICGASTTVHFFGSLVPDGTWLKFEGIEIAGTSWSNRTIAALESMRATFTSVHPVALFGALGLNTSHGDRSVTASFAPAPRRARDDDATEIPSGTVRVMQFSRHVALNRFAQQLAVDTISMELSLDTIRAAHLDGSGSTRHPIRIVQIPLVLLDRSDLQSKDPSTVVVALRGLPTWPVLDAWNRAVALEYLGALQIAQDGRPPSVLPQFDLPQWPRTHTRPVTGITLEDCNTLRWAVVVQIDRDAMPANENPASHDFRPGGPITVHFRAATPIPTTTEENDRLYVRFQSILRHDKSLIPLSVPWALRAAFTLMSGSSSSIEADLQGRLASIWRGFVIQSRQLFYTGTDEATRISAQRRRPQRVRLGAMDLEFDPEFRDHSLSEFSLSRFDDKRDNQTLLQVCFRRPRVLVRDDLPQAKLRVLLRVNRLTPGGQDGLPDEPFNPGEQPLDPEPKDSSLAIARRFSREAPITIPLEIPASGPFTLLCKESTAEQQSQLLSVQVFERSKDNTFTLAGMSSAKQFTLVIMDRQPLLIAQVEAPPFRGLAGADGNREVGNWSSAGFEGASWELAGATDGFRLTLPPQSIGEGAEKRTSDTMNPGPMPNGTTPDVREPFAAPFRLGPPARLRLSSGYFRQNFTEAVWNLRRILGYPGQRAPGAAASEMRFELLYGLGCEIRVIGLRVAELASRLGAVPKALPTDYNRPFGDLYEKVPELATTFDRY